MKNEFSPMRTQRHNTHQSSDLPSPSLPSIPPEKTELHDVRSSPIPPFLPNSESKQAGRQNSDDPHPAFLDSRFRQHCTLHASDPLFSSNESEAYLGLSPGTLSVWRCNKRYDIPYIKIGRLVRYRKSALDAWLNKRTVDQ